MAYIFKDLNARDPFVSTSDSMMLEDTKVVVQSIWRLITTEVGEIPYFRNYGLSLKKFSQYPLTKETIDGIQKYIKTKIETWETRGTVEHTYVDANIEKGELYYTFYIKVKSTGESVALPAYAVKVST